MNYLSKEKERAKIRRQAPKFRFATEVDFENEARYNYQRRYTDKSEWKKYLKAQSHRIARRKGDAELERTGDAPLYDIKSFDYKWRLD